LWCISWRSWWKLKPFRAVDLIQALSLLFYNIGMLLYYTAAKVSLLFLPKAKDWIEGRKATAQLLKTFSKPTNANRIWFHCSSLGEFEQARPLMERIKHAKPDAFVLLTFFSPSGYNIRKDFALVDVVCYLPHDTKANAREMIAAFQPTLVLWTKYDFFYHFLHELKTAKVPVVLFAARFLPEQVFFKSYGVLFRNMLRCFTKIYVQDEASRQLLSGIKIESEQANDTRFDRVIAIANERKTFPTIEQFIDGRRTVVCGSTWQQDEALLAEIIKENTFENTAWIIAPHNVNPQNIQRLQDMLGDRAVLLSSCQTSSPLPPPKGDKQPDLSFSTRLPHTGDSVVGITKSNVLIIDSIGMLSSIYAYARVAYIGGGFGVSVHNVLEAAVYGVAVLFGSNYQKSVECIDLIKAGGAFSINNQSELRDKLNILMQESVAVKTGEIARRYVLKGAGGTEKIFTFVEQHLIG